MLLYLNITSMSWGYQYQHVYMRSTQTFFDVNSALMLIFVSNIIKTLAFQPLTEAEFPEGLEVKEITRRQTRQAKIVSLNDEGIWEEAS